MAVARAKGKLRGKSPKLSDKQQKELCRMHGTGDYSISDLAEVFSVSRPTVYRTLGRQRLARSSSSEIGGPGRDQDKIDLLRASAKSEMALIPK
jgi:DNA invertase Pin-like site-specific DNA recombinase